MAISETGSAVDNNSGTAVSVTHSLTINANDVVIAVVHANASGNSITDNNGGTAFVEDYEADTESASSSYAIYSRVAGVSEPSAYAWTLGSSQTWSVQVRVFDGVDTAGVWDVAPASGTRAGATSGTTATTPDMTTSNAGAMGIALFLTDSGLVTYDGVTNGYGTEVEPSLGIAQASYIQVWASAGATGTTAATLSTSNDWEAHQIALKPESLAVALKDIIGIGIIPFSR